MSKKVTLFALSSLVSLVAAGCADGPQAPIAPSAATGMGSSMLETVIDTPLEDTEGLFGQSLRFDPHATAPGAVGGRASGHAQIQGTPVQGVRDQRYSFTADPRHPAPTAKGQVQVQYALFTGHEVRVHADVTCTSVVGNQAWVGTRVRRLVIDGEEIAVDRRMIFRVQDNGDDAKAADLASLVFFGAPGLDFTHCNTRQQFPALRATTNGNLHVQED